MPQELIPVDQIDRVMKEPLGLASRGYHRVGHGLRFVQEREFLLGWLRGSVQLRMCEPESVVHAMLQAAALGLSLNPMLHQVYLIPRRARRRADNESAESWSKVPWLAYASPGYRGMIDIAVRGGAVKLMAAEVVFANDRFRYFGPLRMPEHEQVTKASERTFESAIGVYAVARLSSGDGVMANYLDSEQVARIRQKSEAPNGLMWAPQGLWSEGWKKAAIRRLWKTLPTRSEEMMRALALLDRHEGLAVEPAGEVDGPAPPEPPAMVTAQDVADLRVLLTERGVEAGRVDAWLTKMAQRLGIERIEQLPASSLPAAKQLLVFAVERQRVKQEGADNAKV